MGSGAVGQDASADAVCALLTPQEVAAALGTDVEAEGYSDQWTTTCTWSPTDLESYAYLYAQWASGTADDIRSENPAVAEIVVDGHPAWYDIGVLYVALDPGVLTLQGAPEEGDEQAALTGLAELAVSRSASLPTPAVVEVAADPVAGAFCALFTADEVGGILGNTVHVEPDVDGCRWSAAASGGSANASASWTVVSLAQQKEAWPDGEDVTVGGHLAYYSPGMFLNELLIELDPGVLWLVITGFDGDVKAALTELGELAVSRSASLPPPPEPEPVADLHADPALEALFPTALGGQPLTVQSAAGSVLAQGDEESRRQIEEALASVGKTLADVTLAVAFTPDFSGSVTAFRIAGADAAALLPTVLALQAGGDGVTQTPGRVGAKDVVVVEGVGAGTQYYYTKDDVVWVVQAQEPALTEIFDALP
jgi:hypothetical protein